jgi:hypothetical protein
MGVEPTSFRIVRAETTTYAEDVPTAVENVR